MQRRLWDRARLEPQPKYELGEAPIEYINNLSTIKGEENNVKRTTHNKLLSDQAQSSQTAIQSYQMI